MMIGSCIIDNVDIWAYGAFIERNGSNDFLSFPDRRKPDLNDWAEHDGLDVDLSDLSFDAKKVSVNYVILGSNETVFKQHLNSFQTLHFSAGYRNIFVREFNKIFTLRFLGFSRYAHKGGMVNKRNKRGYLTADYMMDDPTQIFTAAIDTPISDSNISTYTEINQIGLSQFGIVVQDIYSTSLRPHSAKRMLERKSDYRSGMWADVGVQSERSSRQITIRCTMTATTLNEFYINYSALFQQMNSTTAIKITSANEEIDCYYSKMSNFKKEAPFKRKIKVSFELNFNEI